MERGGCLFVLRCNIILLFAVHDISRVIFLKCYITILLHSANRDIKRMDAQHLDLHKSMVKEKHNVVQLNDELVTTLISI